MYFGSVGGTMSSMQLNRISQSGSRVLVPVRPSQTAIAQYRYIGGTPASNGQQTVPLPRIHLLNTLINKLMTRNKNLVPHSIQDISPEQTDALLKQYASELHQAIKAVPESFGTFGSSVDVGMLFQFSV